MLSVPAPDRLRHDHILQHFLQVCHSYRDLGDDADVGGRGERVLTDRDRLLARVAAGHVDVPDVSPAGNAPPGAVLVRPDQIVLSASWHWPPPSSASPRSWRGGRASWPSPSPPSGRWPCPAWRHRPRPWRKRRM